MTAKKTEKTTEVFEFPTFDIAEMTDGYREFADKSLTQSKEAYAKVKVAAEDATKAVETMMENAQAGTVELSLKAIDAVRTNADQALSHMEALLGVKSFAQLIELQTAFIRKQSEAMVDQAKTLQATAGKVAEKVAKPVKTAAEKAVNEIKAA